MSLNKEEEFVGPPEPIQEKKVYPFEHLREETIKYQKNPYSGCIEHITKLWRLPLSQQQYGNLVIRLKYDNLSRKKLAAGIVDLYLSNDEDFMRCLDKIKDKYQKNSKKMHKNRLNIRNSLKKEKENFVAYGLEKIDVNDLYTFLEKDLPEHFVSFEEEKEMKEKQK